MVVGKEEGRPTSASPTLLLSLIPSMAVANSSGGNAICK